MKKITITAAAFAVLSIIALAGCENGSHVHTAGSEWLRDATGHWNLCDAGDGEIMNKAAHAPADGICAVCGYNGTPGHIHAAGSEWLRDAAGHWNLCDAGDGEIMNKAAHAPADGICAVCGYDGRDHDFSGEWQKDAAGHWKECPDDGEKGDFADHALENGICAVCGYNKELSGTVSITGDMEVGETLTAAIGEDTNGTDGKFNYQWTRTGKDGTSDIIDGATDATYEVSEDDRGFTLGVDITNDDTVGKISETCGNAVLLKCDCNEPGADGKEKEKEYNNNGTCACKLDCACPVLTSDLAGFLIPVTADLGLEEIDMAEKAALIKEAFNGIKNISDKGKEVSAGKINGFRFVEGASTVWALDPETRIVTFSAEMNIYQIRDVLEYVILPQLMVQLPENPYKMAFLNRMSMNAM